MAWIESHTVLARHRKTLELAFDLNVKPIQVVGHLHVFWHTVLEQQEDGDLSRWSDQLIAQAAMWEGDAAEFVARLRERGWIDGHLVHDWIDYVGPYLTKKYSSGNQARLKEIWLKHGYKYGKGNGKYAKQKASGKRAASEMKSALPFPSLPNPSSPLLSEPDPSFPSHDLPAARKRAAAHPDEPPKSREAWESYKQAYHDRYGVPPVSNASTNAMLCKLVEKLGKEEAPQVAAFYVKHNGQWYVSKMHPVNLLLQDAEKLRTEWATGGTMTQAKAQQLDRTQTIGAVFTKLMNEEQQREQSLTASPSRCVRTDQHGALRRRSEGNRGRTGTVP